ncbi:MFS transporter permease [Vallicoccus soli]|uniref:MFS transporter permease n=1 Tax=Vallicoccus soli TaxID=2339232 RepID=UPI001059C645|nr:MFS transporter permease [Vallicoccus soli]
MSGLVRWLHAPVPEARAAVFRVLVYLFVPLDVLVLHTSGEYHGHADPAFYQPLLVGRVLPLPTPTVELVQLCKWGVVLLACALVVLCVRGRYSRVLGWTVFALYLEYQVIAFSYGKVDHDRFGYLLALAVVPTLGAVRLRSATRSEAAGWTLRMAQLGAVATYFYAAFAKLRFGGLGWVTSGTVARAVIRRGTWVADELLRRAPSLIQASQWGIMAMELLAPGLFALSERWRRRVVAGFFVFHLVTYVSITIAFWPHLLTLLAFLPLERLVGVTPPPPEPSPLARWLPARLGGRPDRRPVAVP